MIRIIAFVAFIAVLVYIGMHKYVDFQSEKQGVMAQCKDLSLSYSATRSGTCAGHGGVKKWTKE